jgi:hypothetical protein
MAHFAKLDSNNIVTEVLVVSNEVIKVDGVEREDAGVAFCGEHVHDNESVWKQTSYNARGNGFRGNFAGIGYSYMEGVRTLGVASTDIFIDPRPEWKNPGNGSGSWSIGITTAQWYSPLGSSPFITDEEYEAGKRYYWDEAAYQADNTVGWALTSIL